LEYNLKYIGVQTDLIDHVKTLIVPCRDELQIALRIIYKILDGCDLALPFWTEPPLEIEPYENCIERLDPVLGTSEEVTMPDGGNVRCFLVQTMSALQEIMLKNVEDDTRSLIILQWVSKSMGCRKEKSQQFSNE
jgi:proteasome activator subunit 4